MARLALLIMSLLIFVGHASAQEEPRTSIIIEAEIIRGLDASSGTDASSASAGQPAQTTTGPAATTDAVPDPTDAAPAVSQTQAQQTVNQVASSLIQQSNLGGISMADTAMVAALGRRPGSRQQNLDALVSVMVVENGAITSSSMQNLNIPADVFGQQVAAGVGILPVGALGSGGVMRRSAGISYFYVQICSCGL